MDKSSGSGTANDAAVDTSTDTPIERPDDEPDRIERLSYKVVKAEEALKEAKAALAAAKKEGQMAWANSKIFSATITDVMENTTALDANADTFKAALFDNTITPSQTVASASTAYNAGVWNAGGVSDVTGWPAVGRNLVVTSGFASNVYTFDSADTVSANDTTTLTNAYGCLCYDDTLAAVVVDQGLCYNYFGGANSVTSGRFTIIWNTAGVLALTL